MLLVSSECWCAPHLWMVHRRSELCCVVRRLPLNSRGACSQAVEEDRIEISASHFNVSRQGHDMESHNRAISPEFMQLVVDQHQQLRSFVRTLGVAPDWVDDLAQEALLVAWREQDSFDRQRDLGKWLRGIARNLVRNELRKQQRQERLLHQGLAELLVRAAEAEPEPESWAECRVPVLRDCVEQLAPKSRELVSGRYGDGWKAPGSCRSFQHDTDCCASGARANSAATEAVHRTTDGGGLIDGTESI